MNPNIFSNEEEKALRESVLALKLLPIYSSIDFTDITGIDHEDVDSVLKSYPCWDLYDEGACDYDASCDVIRIALGYFSSGTIEEKRLMRARISLSESIMDTLLSKFNYFFT